MKGGGLTVFSGTLIMITTMMGSGVIFMPSSFSDVGYILGPLILLAISLVSLFTLYAISYAASKVKGEKVTYYSAGEQCSSIVAFGIDFCIALQGFGSCVVYIIAVRKWIFKLIPSVKGYGLIIVPLLIFVMFLLAIQRSLKNLKFVTYLSVSSVFYLMAIICFYSFSAREMVHEEPLIAFGSKYYSAVSNIIFAMGCHQNIVQVYSELENRTIKNITMVSLFSIISGASIYFIVGFFGYRLMGDLKGVSVLDKFLDTTSTFRGWLAAKGDNGYAWYIGVVVFIALLFCAFPIQLHPTRNSMMNMYCQMFGSETNKETLRISITILICLVCLILGLIEKLQYELVVGLIGATGTNAITYIFPCILFCYTIKKVNLASIISSIVGIFGVLASIYLVYQLLSEHSSSDAEKKKEIVKDDLTKAKGEDAIEIKST